MGFQNLSCKRAGIILLLVFLLVSIDAYSQGLKPPETPRGVAPLFIPSYPGLSRFFADSTLFNARFAHLRRSVRLDSTQQFIDVEEKLFGEDYRLPVRVDLNYYANARLKFDLKNLWAQRVLENMQLGIVKGGGGIELNIPVRIKNKAFQRIFGGDKVGLRVTGNISFDLSGRTENRSGSAVSSFETRNNFSPKFNQTQQFRVEGKVGDKVSVSVDQNSEATFDLENTLKLTYTGDPDEIVQKIEAGNVALSLPATNYVSTSSRNQGLFGLKTDMKVGNLKFTGIASLQRGQKQKITKTGKASENTFRIKDYEYVRNRYFLVDSLHMALFDNFDERMRWLQPSNLPRITQLDVWISTRYDDQEGRRGFAVLHPETFTDADTLNEAPGIIESGNFKKLEFPKDYGYDELRGYFWINTQVNEGTIIGIAYQTEDGVKHGMLFSDVTDSTRNVILKLIKPRAAKPEFRSTWRLAMKNVYNLGAENIPTEGFNLKVLLTVTGQDQDVQPVPPAETFNFLMGLDRLNDQGNVVSGGDKKVDLRNGFIFDLSHGFLIFPTLHPFDTKNPQFAIDSSLAVDIYDLKDRTLERVRSKFEIEVTTSTVSTSYDLGFNVLEGSETVRLNGRTLEKDKGYTIDYFSGKVQILDPDARRADAQVSIDYERGQLFQLDKKTLLGGRLEYKFGEQNFLGMTALYFKQSTLDQRIRVGQEPLSNFIWDVNTAFTLKPNFLSRAFDKLPIVETSAESRLKVEAEYAQVNPNPNTFNDPRIGDNTGVAYIDDFEGSKRSTSLGVQFRIWTPASIPVRFRLLNNPTVDYNINSNDDAAILRMDKNRIKLNWYNPFNQVPIKDIWPNKDVNSQTGTTTNVLKLRWLNKDTPIDSAWAGIMRSTIAFPDQKKSKFLDIWIKGDLGQVNVDIGRISEDYWVRGKNFEGRRSLRNLNTEDFNGNGLLDPGEDVGIDGIPDGQPGDDPEDNWKDPTQSLIPFFNINGTEGNGEAKGARFPDSEDLDGDGGLSLFNEYFEYSFDLADQVNPFIQGSTTKGWRLYRIPLRKFGFKIGNPDSAFQEIFSVRLWLNNLPPDDSLHSLLIATFEFSGNEWEEQGVAMANSDQFVVNDSLFNISVANTEENVVEVPGGPEPYKSPPKVEGIRDRITRAISKEQSLVMQLNYLPNGARAEAKKQLPERMNLLHYRKLKMFVHGDRNLMEADSLEFYIRFGPTPNVYYEYGEKVYAGWDPRNNILLDFDELAQTKQEKYLSGDTLGNVPIFFRRDPKNPEKYFRVVGRPGLHNISYFVIGARNSTGRDLENMEIWVDEMRVTGVERDKGTAMRLMSDLTLADIGHLTAQWEIVDDNFRRLEQKFPSKSGTDATRENQSYFATLKLDKFLPESWGLSIPIDGRYTRSRSVPKYFFNTDRRTKYSTTGLSRRLKTFFGFSELSPELEANSTITTTKALGGTIKRRQRERDPWFLKYTFNQMVLDVDYSNRHFSNPNTLFSNSQAVSGRFDYTLPFSSKNNFQPLHFLKHVPVLKSLSRTHLYYTPSNIAMGFTLNDNETISQNRIEAKEKRTINTTTTRHLSVNYRLLDNLQLNYNRNYKSDAFYKGYRAGTVLKKIFSSFDFGLDRNIAQRFGANYNPQFTSWLKPTLRYTADFTYNLNDPETNNRSSNLNRQRQLTIDFKPSILANKIYNPSKKIRGRRRSPGRRGTIRQGEEKDKSGKKEKKDKEGNSPLKYANPAFWLWHFFNAWRTAKFDINFQDNFSNFNLDDFPSLGYQFGFTGSPGVGLDTTFRKIPILPGFRKIKRVNGTMNFDFARNLITTFRYTYNKQTNQNNQVQTETQSTGYFFTGDDPDASRSEWRKLVPDWNVKLTGLEKLKFLPKVFRRISIEHARTGKFTESDRFQDSLKVRDQWGYANTYQPMLGINISTKWELSGSVRYIKSSSFGYSRTGSVTKNLQSSFNVSASYSATKGFRIPLFGKKRLKNEINFSFVYDKTSTRSFSRRPGETGFQELEVNDAWKVRPSVNYRFSDKVNGTAFMETGASKNKRTGKYSYFEFGIKVNIGIR